MKIPERDGFLAMANGSYSQREATRPAIPRFTTLSLPKKRAHPADLYKTGALGSNFSCAVENSGAISLLQDLKNKRFSAKKKKMPEWRKKGLRG